MFKEVYITHISKFLPNEPVGNNDMEEYLGMIHDKPSKSRRIVLKNNGITRRYYAIDKSGIATHTNAEMVALAIDNLFGINKDALKSVDLLSCGTSTPDQMIPSHAVMVHGWLKNANPMEVVSLSGVCCSGMHALKYAWMSVKLGQVRKAISTGSERVSRTLRAEMFEEEAKKLKELEKNPYISFDKDFLRWMLSDGAGAFLLSDQKKDTGFNLRIEWMEGASYAHIVEPCMYSASEKTEDGKLKSYMDYSVGEMVDQSVLSIKQDVKLLRQHIIAYGVERMKTILQKENLDVAEINYFLPHISSEFFRIKLAEELEAQQIGIKQHKWFTNLSIVGNVGAGSIYLMMEELFNSGSLRKGEKILLVVPESARFSYMYTLLTVC